ncbi:hypothetical protein RJT34_17104 [Clitoria ternatea]|uniref:Uncharacterized protein n=1 Tax=Clitoria ternatea TaxID=43366 RepID=A0AAN9J8L9_CLITE
MYIRKMACSGGMDLKLGLWRLFLYGSALVAHRTVLAAHDSLPAAYRSLLATRRSLLAARRLAKNGKQMPSISSTLFASLLFPSFSILMRVMLHIEGGWRNDEFGSWGNVEYGILVLIVYGHACTKHIESYSSWSSNFITCICSSPH